MQIPTNCNFCFTKVEAISRGRLHHSKMRPFLNLLIENYLQKQRFLNLLKWRYLLRDNPGCGVADPRLCPNLHFVAGKCGMDRLEIFVQENLKANCTFHYVVISTLGRDHKGSISRVAENGIRVVQFNACL